MIARTIEVTAEFTSNIIEATAIIADHVVEADATLTTSIRHWQTEYPDYDGDYTIAPDWEAQTLATQNTVMHSDVTVEAIYLNSAQNPSGGNTVYIGGLIDA